MDGLVEKRLAGHALLVSSRAFGLGAQREPIAPHDRDLSPVEMTTRQRVHDDRGPAQGAQVRLNPHDRLAQDERHLFADLTMRVRAKSVLNEAGVRWYFHPAPTASMPQRSHASGRSRQLVGALK